MEWEESEMIDGETFITKPGSYEAEVVSVSEKKNDYGDNIWGLKFKEIETGKNLCWDNLTFSKNARGSSLKKMSILGVEKNASGFYQIESKDELVGMRVKLHLIEETYGGKTRLKPDYYSKNFGYEVADVPF